MNSDQIRKQLDINGYVVIPKILTNDEIKSGRDGLFNWLEMISDGEITENIYSRYADKGDCKGADNVDITKMPYCYGKKGIIQWYNVGHSQFVWDIRQNSAVVKVFSDIWKTDELLVSFDGINIQLPTEITKKYSDPFGLEWHHMDQRKTGLLCIQGFVNLEDTTDEDGCLIVRPKSHQFHTAFMDEFGEEFVSDWIKLGKKHLEWFDKRELKPIRVAAPKGSIVLWDSRVVHANATAVRNRKNKGDFRLVVYVCMVPKERASQETLRKKQKYFNERRMTNHWPTPVKVFPVKPFLRGKENEIYLDKLMAQRSCDLKLSHVGMKLAGF
jgi:ectoine hydroxylase-related dioxygenase (phytanoyl-CoA dioxygenase family)